MPPSLGIPNPRRSSNPLIVVSAGSMMKALLMPGTPTAVDDVRAVSAFGIVHGHFRLNASLSRSQQSKFSRFIEGAAPSPPALAWVATRAVAAELVSRPADRLALCRAGCQAPGGWRIRAMRAAVTLMILHPVHTPLYRRLCGTLLIVDKIVLILHSLRLTVAKVCARLRVPTLAISVAAFGIMGNRIQDKLGQRIDEKLQLRGLCHPGIVAVLDPGRICRTPLLLRHLHYGPVIVSTGVATDVSRSPERTGGSASNVAIGHKAQKILSVNGVTTVTAANVCG